MKKTIDLGPNDKIIKVEYNADTHKLEVFYDSEIMFPDMTASTDYKIGEKVIITNINEVYSTYSRAFKALNFKKIESNFITDCRIGSIFAISKHHDNEDILIALNMDDGNQLLIGVDGIRHLDVPKFKRGDFIKYERSENSFLGIILGFCSNIPDTYLLATPFGNELYSDDFYSEKYMRLATYDEVVSIIEQLHKIYKDWDDENKMIVDMGHIPYDGEFVRLKDGPNCIFIFKAKQAHNTAFYAGVTSIGTYNRGGLSSITGVAKRMSDNDEVEPASEEQIKYLLNIMEEYGDYWDEVKKEVTKVKPIRDKDLVWCWDYDAPYGKCLRLYNAYNNATWDRIRGTRGEIKFTNYEAYKGEWPEWAKEAVKKLK